MRACARGVCAARALRRPQPSLLLRRHVATTDPGFFSRLVASGADLYEWAHLSLGLPYWACLAGSTVVLRLAVSPLLVISMKNAHNLQLAKPELDRLTADFRRAGDNSQREVSRRAFKKKKTSLTHLLVPPPRYSFFFLFHMFVSG